MQFVPQDQVTFPSLEFVTADPNLEFRRLLIAHQLATLKRLMIEIHALELKILNFVVLVLEVQLQRKRAKDQVGKIFDIQLR
jgi:hypothetical protein